MPTVAEIENKDYPAGCVIKIWRGSVLVGTAQRDQQGWKYYPHSSNARPSRHRYGWFGAAVSRRVRPTDTVTILYDDRVPSLVRVQDIAVEEVGDPCPVCGQPDHAHHPRCPRGDRPEPPYLSDVA